LLPYSPAIGHGPWRLEKEYGNGHLVDWGIHNIDIIRTIMGFNMPEIVEASGGIFVLKDKITTPDTLNAIMQFNGIPVVWEHRMWGTGDLNPMFNNGVFFYGDKGTLFASDNNIVLKTRDVEHASMEIPTPDMQEKHVAEFINAVKTNNKNMISCEIEDAHNSTTAVQLAMIAYETESKLKWDGNSTLTGHPEAQKHLARPYRNGYQRPVV
jgi:predicted dehydrogenase